MDNNWSWQGGIFGTNAVEFGNNSNVDGPIVGSQILLSNNLATNAFPLINVVPLGCPPMRGVRAAEPAPELLGLSRRAYSTSTRNNTTAWLEHAGQPRRLRPAEPAALLQR